VTATPAPGHPAEWEETILSLVVRDGIATIPELQAACGVGTKGKRAISMDENRNIFICGGLSWQFVDALTEVWKYRRAIHLHHIPRDVYIDLAGGVPLMLPGLEEMPMVDVTQVPGVYKTPHWLPVAFWLGALCQDGNLLCPINAARRTQKRRTGR
jgi:hypothetical protein